MSISFCSPVVAFAKAIFKSKLPAEKQANGKLTVGLVIEAIGVLIRVVFYLSVLGLIYLAEFLTIKPARGVIRILSSKKAAVS